MVHLGVPLGRRIGALSLSGAYRGILLDAAAGSGLAFPPLVPEVQARLAGVLATGSSAGNPADGGFTVLTSVDKYVECVDILCDDPNLDVLLLQAELPRETGMAAQWEERFQRIHDLVAARGKRLAFISMYSRTLTDYSREVRARLPHVAFVQETRKSVAVLAALADWSERAREMVPGRRRGSMPAATELARRAGGLNEADFEAPSRDVWNSAPVRGAGRGRSGGCESGGATGLSGRSESGVCGANTQVGRRRGAARHCE